MAIKAQVAAQLKALAAAGDMMAKAVVENTQDIKLSAGAEASNVIKVTGQILDGAGNPEAGVKDVVVKSYPVSGAGTMADGGAGVVKKGAASTEVWMQTDANGKFELDVTNAAAEDNLIVAQTGDGDVAMLKLTFA
jgi:hypothetical protein